MSDTPSGSCWGREGGVPICCSLAVVLSLLTSGVVVGGGGGGVEVARGEIERRAAAGDAGETGDAGDVEDANDALDDALEGNGEAPLTTKDVGVVKGVPGDGDDEDDPDDDRNRIGWTINRMYNILA